MATSPSTPTIAPDSTSKWVYAAAVLAILIWGATPAATETAVRGVDAAAVGMLRTIIAAIILLPLALLLRLPLPTDAEGWMALVVSSLAGFVGFTLLFTIGIEQTSTSHAALILAAAPILTGLIGFTLSQQWPRWLWWLGAGIALVGEAVLIGVRTTAAATGGATLQGDLIVFASVVFVSAGYVAGGYLSAKIGTQAATAWGINIAGLALMPVLLSQFSWQEWVGNGANLASWLSVFYLAIFASILGYAAWYWAIEKAGVARVAPIQFAQPVVSLILAVVLFSEPMTIPILLSTGMILLGVLLTRQA